MLQNWISMKYSVLIVKGKLMFHYAAWFNVIYIHNQHYHYFLRNLANIKIFSVQWILIGNHRLGWWVGCQHIDPSSDWMSWVRKNLYHGLNCIKPIKLSGHVTVELRWSTIPIVQNSKRQHTNHWSMITLSTWSHYAGAAIM